MDVISAVETVRSQLKLESDISENEIDMSFPIIPPYCGEGKIKLIILGQDPTIKNRDSRQKISCTLNLDKNNALRSYISSICKLLGLSIDNVYATNVFKYFYTVPPASTISVLKAHLDSNLDLLSRELSSFSEIPIITLGEPVLQLLTHDKAKLREYWDYDNKSKNSNGTFLVAKAVENKLDRDFFPFPHQPSIRKAFYKNTIGDYIQFMRDGVSML